MAVTTTADVNEEHDPSPHEETVLDVLKRGRDRGVPWGFATPSRIALIADVPRQRINEALDRLTAAGWVEQVEVDGETVRGLYRFIDDPREEGDD